MVDELERRKLATLAVATASFGASVGVTAANSIASEFEGVSLSATSAPVSSPIPAQLEAQAVRLPCRYFARGFCKLGRACRDTHLGDDISRGEDTLAKSDETVLKSCGTDSAQLPLASIQVEASVVQVAPAPDELQLRQRLYAAEEGHEGAWLHL